MPRQREPKDDDRYGRWIEQVIGSTKKAEHGPQMGSYGYFRKRVKWLGLTVIADVYPDMGTKSADEPHLWGVVYPNQDRLTKFEPKTQRTIEVRPHAREKKFGGKAPTLAAAQAIADECMAAGREWDGLARNANGTLKVLDHPSPGPQPPSAMAYMAGDSFAVPFEGPVSDDVPDDA